MTRPRVLIYSFLLGLAFMLAGLFCVSVTIAGNDYRSILRWGVGFAALSVVCLSVVVVPGSWRRRVAAIILALPLTFVVAEVIRRGGF